MSKPVLEQLERLELELNVFRDHHTLEDLVVIGSPNLENDQTLRGFQICWSMIQLWSCLLEEGLVKLAFDLLRGDAARRLELFGRDADVFHVGSQHEVNLHCEWNCVKLLFDISPTPKKAHQVLVFLKYLLVFILMLLVVRLKDWRGKFLFVLQSTP